MAKIRALFESPVSKTKNKNDSIERSFKNVKLPL